MCKSSMISIMCYDHGVEGQGYSLIDYSSIFNSVSYLPTDSIESHYCFSPQIRKNINSALISEVEKFSYCYRETSEEPEVKYETKKRWFRKDKVIEKYIYPKKIIELSRIKMLNGDWYVVDADFMENKARD